MIFNNNPTNSKVNHYIAYNNTGIQQVTALYEKLLAEKDKVIGLLEAKNV